MSPAHLEVPYHLPGEFETRGIDRLPPTPITEAAHFALQDMGLNEEHIQRLRELTASFRYDLCREKLLRLTESTAKIIKRRGHKTVLLPHFFDLQGRQDGQCGDIALQFWLQAEISGWLPDIQQEALMEPGDRLLVCLCYGYSRTHFTHADAGHQWNGLALVTAKGKVKNFVSIDAAFQEISTLPQNGYTPQRIEYGPQQIEGFAPAAELRLTTLRREKESFRGDFSQAVVVGTSVDKKYVYCLGFVRAPAPKTPLISFLRKPVETGKIIPYLIRLNEKGQTGNCFFHPENGSFMTTLPVDQLTISEKAEIEDLLHICEKIHFEDKRSENIPNLPQTLAVHDIVTKHSAVSRARE